MNHSESKQSVPNESFINHSFESVNFKEVTPQTGGTDSWIWKSVVFWNVGTSVSVCFVPERRRTSPDSDRAALVFPERQISPIPAGDSLCSLSPPSSPRMKSTTRHSRRSHALTAAFTFTPSLTSSSVFTSIRAIFRAIRVVLYLFSYFI